MKESKNSEYNHQNIENSFETKFRNAGVFSSWLRRIRYSLLKGNGIDVPCGTCRGCCTSSKFIHIKPEESQTLSRIPKKLLFNAPLLPKGNMLMGYNDDGHCPMFIDNNCSIYNYRPMACRNYDCRVFSASGIQSDCEETEINKQVRSWRFLYPVENDHALHLAVRATARFITEHEECFPDKRIPTNSSQLSILAIKVYDAFFDCQIQGVQLDKDVAVAIILANEKFHSKCRKA